MPVGLESHRVHGSEVADGRSKRCTPPAPLGTARRRASSACAPERRSLSGSIEPLALTIRPVGLGLRATLRPSRSAVRFRGARRVPWTVLLVGREDRRVELVNGRYKCSWCGADLDLVVNDLQTMEVVTKHDGENVRIILVNGAVRHRCERPTDST